jgi:hypothetical protein
MKLTTKILAGAAALAFVTLTAGSLQADDNVQVTNVVSISFVAAGQNSTTDKDGVSTTGAPVTKSANMTDILGWLAVDENAESKYGETTFPAGAKLVVIGGSGNSPDLQVLDKHNNFLVDVSDILSLTNSGVYGSDVSSGKTSDTTSLADPSQTDQQVYTVNYDDSLVTGGANVQFSFSGVIKNVTTDSTPNKTTGVFKETQSHTISGGQGDGVYHGIPAIVTGGSFKATGSGTGIYLP